jgi:glycerol-3-phosphate dehydrogenase
VRLMAERTDWRMPLLPGSPSVGAEIVYAIRSEMAVTLADLVVRRTELGAMGRPHGEMVKAMAWIASGELGWDQARLAAELASLDAFYRQP